MKATIIRFNEQMVEELDCMAQERGVTRSSIIKELLFKGLKRERAEQ